MKRQSIEWEKIFVIQISDKRLIIRIYGKTPTSIAEEKFKLKWIKNLSRHLFKDVQMNNKHMKNYAQYF